MVVSGRKIYESDGSIGMSDVRISGRKVQMDLKKIDYKGYFEADDEVGQIFNQIKTTVDQLNRFKGEEQ